MSEERVPRPDELLIVIHVPPEVNPDRDLETDEENEEEEPVQPVRIAEDGSAVDVDNGTFSKYSKFEVHMYVLERFSLRTLRRKFVKENLLGRISPCHGQFRFEYWDEKRSERVRVPRDDEKGIFCRDLKESFLSLVVEASEEATVFEWRHPRVVKAEAARRKAHEAQHGPPVVHKIEDESDDMMID